jgi:dTDP-4-dehydrorhamnose reductase
LRILLIGRDGQLGQELERTLTALGQVMATDRNALDLANAGAVRRMVRETRPQIVVNAAAYTAVDSAESEIELAEAVNTRAPAVLAEEVKRLDALLVHYSTDYVFDGEQERPYREEDATNPLNVYGRTKRDGERGIIDSACRYLLLRTSWIYGARGRNFLLSIIRKAGSGHPLRVVNDQIGAPTSNLMVAEATPRAIAQVVQDDSLVGIYHMSAGGKTTWHGFACAILTATGTKQDVEGISSAEYGATVSRPRKSVLDNSKLAHGLGIRLPPWETGMVEVLAQLHNH